MEIGEIIHMKGDIIITDPCYIIKDDLWDRFLEEVPCGNISIIGRWREFKEGLVADTLYGDWSCTLFKVKDIDSAIEALKMKQIIKIQNLLESFVLMQEWFVCFTLMIV